MTAWPRTDANLILVFEILLMSAFLIMNATDAFYLSAGAVIILLHFLLLLVNTFSFCLVVRNFNFSSY